MIAGAILIALLVLRSAPAPAGAEARRRTSEPVAEAA